LIKQNVFFERCCGINKKVVTAKFDESVDIAVRGCRSKESEMVRGVVTLPLLWVKHEKVQRQ
jgi:ribosomal protein L1